MKKALAAITLAGWASFAWPAARGDAGATQTTQAAQPRQAADAAAPVPLATDLQRDSRQAARAGEPLILFFTLPDCRYCHTVRHSYLAPLLRSQGEGQGVYVIREVEVGGSRAATGQDGAATTHGALAKRFGVRFAPTVLFVGPAREALAPPLLGGDTAGMYGAYLDARLAIARQAAATRAAATAATAATATRAATAGAAPADLTASAHERTTR
ncbi:thioredoxin family protein [Pseudoduganella sp. UC29_71]|uniref:thioredoxin family protein n=1 Tax=Pseudoduganella sp. UC29_71 TaxID=3350174 RepID=UPI00366C6174